MTAPPRASGCGCPHGNAHASDCNRADQMLTREALAVSDDGAFMRLATRVQLLARWLDPREAGGEAVTEALTTAKLCWAYAMPQRTMAEEIATAVRRAVGAAALEREVRGQGPLEAQAAAWEDATFWLEGRREARNASAVAAE